LHLLSIVELFFINNERWKTVNNNAADALSVHSRRSGCVGQLRCNPAFIAELTGLINQGCWYFEE
jgi:50S ribosomal protein L16 3-hydroxylase